MNLQIYKKQCFNNLRNLSVDSCWYDLSRYKIIVYQSTEKNIFCKLQDFIEQLRLKYDSIFTLFSICLFSLFWNKSICSI